MANWFNLVLDTTGVANPSISINDNAVYATNQLVTLTIGTTETPTTGYQMIIWGDVDTTYDTNVKDTVELSKWITYDTSKQIKLSATDGTKRINLKLRDDVYNDSALVYYDIILDTTLPTVTISGADVTKVSKVTGKDTASFSFQADCIFDEYKVKVVSVTNATNDTGVQLPTTAGSTNMSGSAGNYAASTPINCTIKGVDLETAASGDGTKIIKVFVKDQSGLWSV